MNNEWVGLLASIVVVSSFLAKNEDSIRKINIIGALLYIVYGVLIGSFSNIFMNAILIAINVRRLWQDQKKT